MHRVQAFIKALKTARRLPLQMNLQIDYKVKAYESIT